MDLRPRRIQIKDFKSIADSGWFTLSTDGITVLAGQNEAGKTSILQAIYEFDEPAGEPSNVEDYLPDFNEDAEATTSIEFVIAKEELIEFLKTEGFVIPAKAFKKIVEVKSLTITRKLSSGEFSLSKEVAELWDDEVYLPDYSIEESPQEDSDVGSPSEQGPSPLSTTQFAEALLAEAPVFVFFDSFGDILPKTVSIQRPAPTPNAPNAGNASSIAADIEKKMGELKQIVKDFLTLAEIDLKKIWQLSEDDRALGNYLNDREARISADFLTYWKQSNQTERKLGLRARVHRSKTGELLMSFYVNDGRDQYPAQRSTGFLWFLSFYLRLAASSKRENMRRLILIDEPGTYLHPKAQKDILHLLEAKIAPQNDVIYSTHSQYLLPAPRLYRAKIVAKNEAGRAFVADRLTDERLRLPSVADALTPVFSSIGLDLSDQLKFRGDRSVIAEGMTDYFYLHAFSQLYRPKMFDRVNIYPATGAPSVVNLTSLTIGWGSPFCVVLDFDKAGNDAAEKLEKELLVGGKFVVRPNHGSIEDVFSPKDFERLLAAYSGEKQQMNANERPSTATKRLKIDKILLARKFSEMQNASEFKKAPLSKETEEEATSLLSKIDRAFENWQEFVK